MLRQATYYLYKDLLPQSLVIGSEGKVALTLEAGLG